MKDVKALLVFCEGPHDVAFSRLVFKHCFGINKINWKFSQYPAPFNQLFKTSMEKHVHQDLSMDMAHKFFLPDRTLFSKENNLLILLFNTGGKSKRDNPAKFIADFLPLLKTSRIFSKGAERIVSEAKYIFLYDADHEGADKVFQDCRTHFAQIDGNDFILELDVDANNPKGAQKEDTAVYVWSDSETGLGTLENVLLPMFEANQEEIVIKASEFIDACFSWEIDHVNPARKIAETARRKKTIICCSGQRIKPGSSMNVIIDQAKMISEDSFREDAEVLRFSKFLSEFIRGWKAKRPTIRRRGRSM